MPTADRIRTAPMFGDRQPEGWTNAKAPWELTQHSERIMLESGHSLALQTSDGQTDDGERGTWHLQLIWPGVPAKVLAEEHVSWCELDAVREYALAWADAALDKAGAFAEGSTEAATVREDIASLAEH